jgi:hypothetical protein
MALRLILVHDLDTRALYHSILQPVALDIDCVFAGAQTKPRSIADDDKLTVHDRYCDKP